MNGRTAAVLTAAALVAAVVAAALVPSSPLPANRPASSRTAIVGAARVCPDLSGSSHRTTRLTVASDPARGAPGRGRVSVTALGHSPAPRSPALTKPRTLYTHDFRAKGSAGRIRAAGGLAGGLEAEQTERMTSGSRRGLVATRCVEPGDDWWFVGPSGGVHSDDALALSNAGPAPAVAGVDIYGEKGPIADPQAQSITVAPGTRKVLAVGKLAPGVAVTALHVRVRTGQVAASLSSARRHPPHPALVGAVPPASAPAREQVLPGVVPGPGRRRLVIVDPGREDADVAVRIVTADGAFVPTGLAHVRVAAGSVTTVKLAPVLDKKAAAVRLSSSRPVTAGLLAVETSSDTGTGDLAWTAVTPALSGRTLITDNRVGGRTQSHLVLSAPHGAARVVVAELGGHRRTVSVPAGRTAFVELGPVVHGATGAVVVAPRPGSGPVYAARDLYEPGARGPLLAVLPLRTAPRTVSSPAARYDPGAALRDQSSP